MAAGDIPHTEKEEMNNFHEYNPSFRAQIITRRTYNRPLNEEGTEFETWADTCARVIKHQKWLWERAAGRKLYLKEREELEELRALMLARKVSVSGRTLWLGGTDIAKKREASQFNCAFTHFETVADGVDAFWNLLQGTGEGGRPIIGTLNGLTKPVQEIRVIRSTRTAAEFALGIRGHEENRVHVYWDAEARMVWRLTIGDDAVSWARAFGKLLALKRPVDVIELDFSQVRAAGIRLKGYGWISSGDEQISKAFKAIVQLLSDRAGLLLTRMDLLDILNHLGTTLSSRRSAEIVLMAYGEPEWEEFALAKKDHWCNGKEHRAQSNNTLLFYDVPSKAQLEELFRMMQEAGGSEPGFYNAAEALRRAPWFKGTNPCGEILLANKNFCNLVEIDVAKFNGEFSELCRAVWIAARANYRQTCVDFASDPVLQRSWHEVNEYLRLCGVGLTGIVKWEYCLRPDMAPQDKTLCTARLRKLRKAAHDGADSMADALGTPRSKAKTTIKPSGTLSKIMDTTEGAHRPIAKFIINYVNFNALDPLVTLLKDANYEVKPNPYDSTGVLVGLPVSYDGVTFDKSEMVIDGNTVTVEVNNESAIDQLERYKWLMDNYVDHNCSVTIYYSPEEVPAMVEWLHTNWDSYCGVSFLYRSDPTKTAEDLGYPYLPQTVVTEEYYHAYVAKLLPVDIDRANSHEMIDDGGCATGACPVR